MASPASASAVPPGFSVRRFRPEDAPGVSNLVRAVYGDSYYPRDLYEPNQIIKLNQTETLVSVVALDPEETVVGHYAFERPAGAAVAEASDAIVAVPSRHHHLMEEMRVVLRAEALRVGLTGLVGYPVTNHLFSQKADAHFGALPCGVAPGLWPRSFHNMPEPLPQRMSFVVCFKYFRPVAETVHAATRHAEMLARITGQYGLATHRLDPAPASGPGVMEVTEERPVETGTIRVRRVGTDTNAAVGAAKAKLAAGGAKAITLELPLADAAVADACRAAEAAGFFFTGLGPAFVQGEDALCLQWLAEDLDPALIQIESPFAKELLAYVDQERRRACGTA